MPALIFDCDGVLADTERDGHRVAFNETFAEVGIPVTWSVEEYAEWAAEARATAFRRAAEYRELWPDVEVNELGRRVRDHVRSHRQLRRTPNALTSIPVTI